MQEEGGSVVRDWRRSRLSCGLASTKCPRLQHANTLWCIGNRWNGERPERKGYGIDSAMGMLSAAAGGDYGGAVGGRFDVDWIVNHGMGTREFGNYVWIIDPQFSFFVCTVELSLQHLSY